jgi:hypothetical protein
MALSIVFCAVTMTIGVVTRAARLGEHRQPVHVRHPQVDKGEIEWLAAQLAERIAAAVACVVVWPAFSSALAEHQANESSSSATSTDPRAAVGGHCFATGRVTVMMVPAG